MLVFGPLFPVYLVECIKEEDLERSPSVQRPNNPPPCKGSRETSATVNPKEAMEIKVVLLVVSAIVTVAAASPLEELMVAKAATAYDCNENAIHYTSIGSRNYALKGCTTRRELITYKLQ